MTTALTIITDALVATGSWDPGEAIDATTAQFCLRRLNRMMESWANERLMAYEITQGYLTLTAGTASYSSTLLYSDAAQTVLSGRPVNVDNVYVTQSNVDYPLEMIDNQTYAEIGFKSSSGLPNKVYVDEGYPNVNFIFFPVPSGAMTARIGYWTLLQDTFTLSTTFALPTGYEKAVVDNLGVDLAPSFGRPVSPDLRAAAIESKKILKRQNYPRYEMATNTPLGQRLFNIQRGY